MAAQLDIEDVLRRPYPEHPGAKARDTSFAAAAAIAPVVKGLRAKVYDAIAARPSTPEEIAPRLGLTVHSTRSRCSELARMGKITDSGLRRASLGGKRAIVWELAPR